MLLSNAATAIVHVGAFVELFEGLSSLVNSQKAAQWKRAELIDNYVNRLNGNDSSVLAGWLLHLYGGLLIAPEIFRFLREGENIMDHDSVIFRRAFHDNFTIAEPVAALPRVGFLH